MSYWIDIDKAEVIRIKNSLTKKGYVVKMNRGRTANYGSNQNPRYSRFCALRVKKGNNVHYFPCFWDTSKKRMVCYYAINDL